jgi:hypothetical protein
MKSKWCPGWESNPSGELILRKLLILRNGKMEKHNKNAEVRYTAGTRKDEVKPATEVTINCGALSSSRIRTDSFTRNQRGGEE